MTCNCYNNTYYMTCNSALGLNQELNSSMMLSADEIESYHLNNCSIQINKRANTEVPSSDIVSKFENDRLIMDSFVW